jgi:hypothetical protein
MKEYMVLFFLVFFSILGLLLVAEPTGPNCPGKDPAWLGFCEAAPGRDQ